MFVSLSLEDLRFGYCLPFMYSLTHSKHFFFFIQEVQENIIRGEKCIIISESRCLSFCCNVLPLRQVVTFRLVFKEIQMQKPEQNGPQSCNYTAHFFSFYKNRLQASLLK